MPGQAGRPGAGRIWYETNVLFLVVYVAYRLGAVSLLALVVLLSLLKK